MLILPRHLANEARAHKVKRSLSAFIRAAWHVIEPSEYQHGQHIDAMAEHLEAVSTGQIKRLIINIPPRTMKSIAVSVMFPAWEWLNRPQLKYLTGSYASDFAIRDAVKSRMIIDSKWYQQQVAYLNNSDAERYGVWGFQKDQNAKGYYINTAGGHRYTTSTTAAGTGEGGDRVMMDDPLSAADAHSKAARESAWTHYSETLSTRLNDRKTSARILVMQRLHETDPTGMLLSGDYGYDHLFLPMTYMSKVSLAGVTFDPQNRPTSIGWKDWRKTDGEFLWPLRLGSEQIAELERDLGPYGTAGQLQQLPAPAGGGIFKRDWWQFYKIRPANFERVVISWDMSFKDTDGSDFVCGTVWGFKGPNSYLIDGIVRRLSFVSSCKAVEIMEKAYPQASAILVEDKANGTAIMNQLAKVVRRLIPVNPLGSKIARAYACEPSVAAGNVFLPDPSLLVGNPTLAQFINEFLQQHESFPNGAHDDIVDSFTQAHNWAWSNGIKRIITADQMIKASSN